MVSDYFKMKLFIMLTLIRNKNFVVKRLPTRAKPLQRARGKEDDATPQAIHDVVITNKCKDSTYYYLGEVLRILY